MIGAGMGLERLASLPYLHNREVVQSAILHQKLETDVSLVAPALSRKFDQNFGRGREPFAVGGEINVGYDVYVPVRAGLLSIHSRRYQSKKRAMPRQPTRKG